MSNASDHDIARRHFLKSAFVATSAVTFPATSQDTPARPVAGRKTISDAARASVTGKQPVDWVDPLIGTSYSRWMLFPGPTLPFGMVKLSPDNQTQTWKAGYEYTIASIAGFSHLHSWTMGGLLTMPATGRLLTKPGTPSACKSGSAAGYRSRFKHEDETASPGYYAVTLYDYDIRAELTTTTRASFQRYTFPAAEHPRILFDLAIPTETGYEVLDARIHKVSDTEIAGYCKQRSTQWNTFTLCFVAQTSKPFSELGGWLKDDILRDVKEISGSGNIGAFLGYPPTKDGEVINLRIGISLVSIDQARLNLETEMTPFGWNFDAVHQNARKTWNALLGKVEVEGGTDEDKTKFYTNMYRSYSGRTIWSDVNGKWMNVCGKTRQLEKPESPMLGSDAFWNTFWNLNQLWTLVTPQVANDWTRSFIEMYKDTGWLPKGPTGLKYSGVMVGSHEIPLMVAAYQKGIRDYDVSAAYAAMRKSQTVQGYIFHCNGKTDNRQFTRAGWDGNVGNKYLTDYMTLGYVPVESGPACATLDYAFDDWTVAQMAKTLGKVEDYDYFSKRAKNYKNIFYPKEGYVWLRHKSGAWAKCFDAYSKKGFTEGNAWQYTFMVPQDMAGLIKMVGKDTFNKRLTDGFVKSRKYDFNAPEDEYEKVPISQGNEPNMQAAYLFNYSGQPWKTQYWVREIMNRYYGSDPFNGWLGDEDEGQMGAWFVMSAMGLFEVRGGAAANPVYEIGSPIFEKITIHLDPTYYSGKTFVIHALGASDKNRFIQSATLNGQQLDKPWFYHQNVAAGGQLVLTMGPAPNKAWGSKPGDAPPSMSTE